MMRRKKSAVMFLSAILLLIGVTVANAEEANSAARPESGKPTIQTHEAKLAEAKIEEAKPTTDLTVSVLSAYISKGDELPIMLCTA